jgi:hypothetical protein
MTVVGSGGKELISVMLNAECRMQTKHRIPGDASALPEF